MGSLKTILLLDDCATIRTILKVYLMNLGADYVEAADGATALLYLESRKIDLVIADVRMSPMDGISFVDHLRSHLQEGLRAVPVILLTSDLDESLRTRGLQAGANAFVHKPISAPALQDAIGRIFPRLCA
ncbi:MAG: response regulator [Deltaproteobacteria bacterium]|nr:response regulator [Deltaproteobacteria bacterium]